MLYSFYKLKRHSKSSGFTLIELLATVVIAGILVAIAAPSWMGLLASQRVNTAQSVAFSKLKSTQSLAKTTRQEMQLSFRFNPTDRALEYAVHTERGTVFTNPNSFGLNCQFLFGPGRGVGGCETWTPILPDRAAARQLSLLVSSGPGTPINTSGPQRITCIRFNPNGTVELRGGCVGANNQYFVFATDRQTKLSCFRISSQIAQITLLKEGQAACRISGKSPL